MRYQHVSPTLQKQPITARFFKGASPWQRIDPKILQGLNDWGNQFITKDDYTY